MKNFGLLLKKLRKAKGLNQDELATHLGVRKTTISNYETGYSMPSSSMLRQIADFFNVSVSELLGETPVMQEISYSSMEALALKQIPVYNAIPKTNLSSCLPLYSMSLPAALLGDYDFFALKITGDRMDRSQLSDGSIALVRKQNFADDGDIAVVSFGNNPAQISRFHRVGEYVILAAESSNPSYHPLVIDLREQPVNILGKVVKTIQSIA